MDTNREIIINSNHCSVLKTMTEYDNNKVIPFIRENVVKASIFWEKFDRIYSTGDDILPQGTRFAQPMGNNAILLVIEEPPAIRTITVTHHIEADLERLKLCGKLEQYGYTMEDVGNGPPYKFTLSFPYIIYIISVYKNENSFSASVFFRNSPISGLGDYLCKANLYNISQGQRLCLGQRLKDSTSENISLIDYVDDIKNRFWFNVFNRDYIYNYQEYEKSGISEMSDYLTWQYFTRVDPMFVYSIKWIPLPYTIGQCVSEIITDRKRESKFENILDALENQTYIRKDIYKEPILSNICDSISILHDNEGIVISIGDEIKVVDKNYYITSFIGSPDGYKVTDIEFEDEDGKVLVKPYTKPLKAFMVKSFIENKITEIDVNGKVVKIDDIIEIKVQLNNFDILTKMLKVNHIRKSRDGKIEVKCNNDYYLLENINFDIINLGELKLCGICLKKDAIYNFKQGYDSRDSFPTVSLTEARFIDIEVSGQSIVAKFKNLTSSRIFRVSFDGDTDYELVGEIKYVAIPLLRIFNYIYTQSNNRSEISPIRYLKGDSVLPKGNFEYVNNGVSDLILNKDKTQLFIPGYDFNIKFAVGDTVVISDWITPNEMLKVRRITQFIQASSKIYIKTEVLGNENLTKNIEFVDLNSGKINIGKIRKIGASFAGIRSGYKIQANEPRIPQFPKKDTNTIIGFIYDTNTKYPLMFCSNGLTLWCSPENLSKFNVYKPTDSKFHKLTNAKFSADTVKIQRGDLMLRKHDSSLVVVARVNIDSMRTYVYGRRYGCVSDGIYSIREYDKYFDRFGILSPRMLAKAEGGPGLRRAFPDLHNGHVLNSKSEILLKGVR